MPFRVLGNCTSDRFPFSPVYLSAHLVVAYSPRLDPSAAVLPQSPLSFPQLALIPLQRHELAQAQAGCQVQEENFVVVFKLRLNEKTLKLLLQHQHIHLPRFPRRQLMPIRSACALSKAGFAQKKGIRSIVSGRTRKIRSDLGISSYVDEVITCINLPMDDGRRNNLIDWRDTPK